MNKAKENNLKVTQEQESVPAPAASSPSKITPPVVTPYEGKKKGIRSSEVIIIIAIIFGVIICGFLIWGVIAFFKNIPEWWKNIFGFLPGIYI